MERLTTRNSEGIGVLKHPYQCERCGDLQWSLPDLGNGTDIGKTVFLTREEAETALKELEGGKGK